jgi:DNA-binding NarL/FixJ family response regulator
VAGINGVEAARRFSQEFPDVRIVAHSMYLERAFVVETLKAGASGYVHKSQSFPELLRSIRAVVGNEVYLCPRSTSVVVNGYLKGAEAGSESANGELTSREQEVLRLLADGKSSKQVALELHISTKTVDTHRRQIMTRLGLYSLAELTKYAIRCGLTSID